MLGVSSCLQGILALDQTIQGNQPPLRGLDAVHAQVFPSNSSSECPSTRSCSSKLRISAGPAELLGKGSHPLYGVG